MKISKGPALAVGSAVMALSATAQATDFGLESSQFIIADNTGNQVSLADVSAGAIVDPIAFGAAGQQGFPTFRLPLLPLNATDGNYSFAVDAVIQDNDSDRRIEVNLGEFTLSVSGGGTQASGSFSNSGFDFVSTSDDGSFTINGSIGTPSHSVIGFSGATLSFNAQAALDSLSQGNAVWAQFINDQFVDDAADYTFALAFKGPADVRLGNAVSGGLQAYGCASDAQIDTLFQSSVDVAGPAYVLQGQFSIGNASIDPANTPSPYQSACPADVTGGGSTGGGGTGGGSAGGGTGGGSVDGVLPDSDDLTGLDQSASDLESSPSAATGVQVEQAVNLAESYRAGSVEGIASGAVGTEQAIRILDSISATARATARVAEAGSGGIVTTAGAGAANVLRSAAQVLAALDARINEGRYSGAPIGLDLSLTAAQKAQVRSAAASSVTAALRLWNSAAASTDIDAARRALGDVVARMQNLGVEVDADMQEGLLNFGGLNAGVEAVDRYPTLNADNALNARLLGTSDLSARLPGLSATGLARVRTLLANSLDTENLGFGPQAGVMDSLRGGFEAAFAASTQITSQADVGQLIFQLESAGGQARVIPGRAVSASAVCLDIDAGLIVRGDGSVLVTRNEVGTVVVPAPYAPVEFYGDLAGLGSIDNGDDGNLSIVDESADFHLSATFDYQGIVSGGTGGATTRLEQPEGADEADLSYVYQVVYRDGTRQNLQPFVEADAFGASIRARGLPLVTNRNTGVVTVNGRRFRPAYFVETPSAEAAAFWRANADAQGIAYRGIFLNADDKLDIQVITESSVQSAYGL